MNGQQGVSPEEFGYGSQATAQAIDPKKIQQQAQEKKVSPWRIGIGEAAPPVLSMAGSYLGGLGGGALGALGGGAGAAPGAVVGRFAGSGLGGGAGRIVGNILEDKPWSEGALDEAERQMLFQGGGEALQLLGKGAGALSYLPFGIGRQLKWVEPALEHSWLYKAIPGAIKSGVGYTEAERKIGAQNAK